ncbi:MAG: hypothetical protein M3Z87_01135 [Lactobacillus sp.]|nr:hypothetical protein [Lactobacillus sp.]
MKQNWKIITAFAFVIIIIPTLIYCFLAKQATLGEWLGFFGTYFGSAISIGFAYINTRYQLRKEYEKEITENLHSLLRSTDILSITLKNLRYAIYVFTLKKKFHGLKVNYSKYLQVIVNAMSQIDDFKLDIDSVMNQLRQSEKEMIRPQYKKWLDDYNHLQFLKRIETSKPLLDSTIYPAERIIKSIDNFIKISNEIKFSIKKIYEKRTEKI